MNLPQILEQLGLNTQTAEVYQYVLSQQKVSARQIANAVGISRPSVYDHLKVLVARGLVVERDIEHKKYFSPDDPQKVLTLIEEQDARLAEGKSAFKAMLPALMKKGGVADPKVKFYPGKEGFRQVLTDVLLEQPKELLALWPYADMTEVVGEEYLQSFTKKRVRDGISVRAVWPFQKGKHPSIPAEKTRYAPKGTNWRMGSLVYGDKVSFISSLGESFCFTVTSHEFAELMRAQFELVWELSHAA